MKLYWCAQTRAARAVWMLEEAGVDYELAAINIRDGSARTNAPFMAASPMGKVPALADGEVCLSESAAICLYVADRYCAGKLAPLPDDVARGSFLYWMFFTPGVIEPVMAEKVGGWEPNPLRNGWGSFDTMVSTLEAGLKTGPWLLGDWFTAADVMVGSSAAFLKMFNLLPASATIEAYIDRCLARPAYQRALAMELKSQ